MATQVPLTTGSYEARSVIASAQRCVNLYGEANPQDSPFPFTYYPTPGKTALWSPPNPVAARCLYTASNGNLYYVVGQDVYYIDGGWHGTKIGTIASRVTPCVMSDNGDTAVLVDGTTTGYTIDLTDNTFKTYDEAGYLGSTRVDYLDGFLLFNQPNTRNFYSTLLNTTKIDPTYVAAKEGAPDPLQCVLCVHREAWLLGTSTSEVWADAGDPTFPFEEIPGSFIQHGCQAPYSVAIDDINLYFVARDKNGKGVIVQGQSYYLQRISTPAIEAELQTYSSLDDAVGFCYQQDGHTFYQVSFPAADKTWVFDKTTGQWHEREWLDANGVSHRDRAQVAAFAYDTNVVGDWQNGTLYQLDLTSATDAGSPVVRRRGFPHVTNTGRLALYNQFQAEMEVGTDPNSLDGDGPTVNFRYSNTRGKSWSEYQQASLGSTGEFLTVPQWRQLGLARDMVFELSWSGTMVTALNGAYIDVEPVDS